MLSDIRRAAINMLARREHSEMELIRKLQAKNFSEDDIQRVVLQLTKENLVNNNRFIESHIHYKKNRGYGPIRIKMELLQHHISEDIIEYHLNMADNVWLIHARNVWQKRFKGCLPCDFKTRTQQRRFLQFRGFTHEQIDTIIQRYDD